MNFRSYCAPLRLALSMGDFCAVYFMTLLGRCALLSFPALGIVLLLRKTVCFRRLFAKGAVWTALPLVLLLGKLKMYYRSRAFLPLLLWQSWCCGYWWLRYGYLLGVSVCLSLLLCRRIKLHRLLHGRPSATISGRRVYFWDLRVSPFTFGLLSPKIVMPSQAREKLTETELQTILLHERTHIRLGHLWIFFLWDVLCALLWINPFLRLAAPKLREDMEQICDAVTIQRSGQDAAAYGSLILKNLALFRDNSACLPAAFAGETDFGSMKRRVLQVCAYRPFSRRAAAAVGACVLALVLCACAAIHRLSLPQYTELTGYSVFRVDNDVDFVPIYDTYADEQPPVIVVDENTAVVDNAALRSLLPEGSPEDGLYFIMWGGFLKVPGIGGALESLSIDGISDGPTTLASYTSQSSLFYVRLAKWL